MNKFRQKSFIITIIYLFTLYFISIITPFFSKYNYYEQNIEFSYLSPTSGYKLGHLLGTDALGRDFFIRLMQGIKLSITLAIIVVILAVVIGCTYGAVSAYYGGIIDTLLFRIVEVVIAVPNMIYIMLIILAFGNSIKSIILALVITRWIKYAIITRGEVIKLKENEYVIASKGLGANFFWIYTKHLIPNMYEVILVKLTLDIPLIIFSEAFLSFIGIGIPIPYSSLGNLISMGFISIWHGLYLFIIPAITISSITLSFNILGDSLRNILDSKN